ncbi:MAG: RND transporter [Bacteroidota bacterium]|nr:RND transporter [Bacteroidota bacterium]
MNANRLPSIDPPAWLCTRLACLLLLSGCLCGCNRGQNASDDEGDSAGKVDVRTPVTVVSPVNGPIEDYIELNAVSTFLQKSYVKANTNGYLQVNDVYMGKQVEVGQLLFTLKTKEAQSIGNSIRNLDSSFHFSGVNHINAAQRGYITQLNHQAGDYVQDGEQLAVISDRNSFAFLLNIPYELKTYLAGRRTVELLLPDGEKLMGTVGPSMPTMDSVTQTQNIVLRVNTAQPIPENLIAKVRISRSVPGSANAQSLPKSALLTDETENTFWVMKMINDSTAVKIPVKRGIETADRVQITSPLFVAGDRILVTGNYGLSDTAKVSVEKTPAE